MSTAPSFVATRMAAPFFFLALLTARTADSFGGACGGGGGGSTSIRSLAPRRPRCAAAPRALFMVKETEKFSPRRPPPTKGDDDDEPLPSSPDVVPDDYDLTDSYGDSDDDWTPDRDKIRDARERWSRRAEADVPPPRDGRASSTARARAQAHEPIVDDTSEIMDDSDDYFAAPGMGGGGGGAASGKQHAKKAKSSFTEEEEEIIEAMGGRSVENPSAKRESGFLGDSTLREIASDFQIPVCYLADVLCMWDVPVPIDVDVRLGDMVTGEMAFALVEAVHSLDAGELYDRYSNFDLMGLSFEYDIDLKDAFDFCVKEGWNLPFGVRT
eukprot:CAMPEP_0113575618 /NCGR_PEP_ID=MMETSP0015_2-20120614/27800_1 /TAXON_ID=2838 /ORGANISM="Odontella" /LENGTH=326 /DNA_ID=CAMNT_0000478881 /DNA_START=68 /DNA_END=1044 /DNA_ORIENTATION=+ /assembly_acc=CAM_ASM_000160